MTNYGSKLSSITVEFQSREDCLCGVKIVHKKRLLESIQVLHNTTTLLFTNFRLEWGRD